MGEGVPDVFCLQECSTATKKRIKPVFENAGFTMFEGIYEPRGLGIKGPMMYNLILVRNGTFDEDDVEEVSAESTKNGPMSVWGEGGNKPFKYPPVVVFGRIRGKGVTIVTHHTPGSDKVETTKYVDCEASAIRKTQRLCRQAEWASVGEEQDTAALTPPPLQRDRLGSREGREEGRRV